MTKQTTVAADFGSTGEVVAGTSSEVDNTVLLRTTIS